MFDITAQKDPAEIAKGLTKVARWINLNAAAGVEPNEMRVAAVLHGDATKATLSDSAYAKVTKAKHNPHLKLLRELHEANVELFVCGRALAHHGYPQSAVVPEVKVATAALTVLVHKQNAGYAYLPD